MFSLLPNISLIDDKSRQVKFHDIIKEKTVVLNMFYSRCKIKCQPLGRLMCKVNLLLNDYIEEGDIEFVSITLDASNDRVGDILDFKEKVYDNRCKNWNFYTGNYEDIEILRHKLGMYSPETEIDKIKSNHSGGFLIFNQKTGFAKHTEAFDNPIDISRKVIQLITRNFFQHSYDLGRLKYDWIGEDEMFYNIQSINSMFTLTFLPENIRIKFDNYAEKQRGFNFNPFEKISFNIAPSRQSQPEVNHSGVKRDIPGRSWEELSSSKKSCCCSR